jgi:hypothetical protein
VSLTNGIHYDVPRAEVYDAIDRMHWSKLKILGRSPAHLRHAMTAGFEDSNARKLGRVRHIATFEPERYAAQVAVWRGGVRRGKEWDAFKRKNMPSARSSPRTEDLECRTLAEAARVTRRRRSTSPAGAPRSRSCGRTRRRRST